MKTSFVFLALLSIASCSVLTEPEQAPPVAETYFFPHANGLQYIYSNNSQVASDTTAYQIVVNPMPGEPSWLNKVENGIPNPENYLYLFNTDIARDGVHECILINQTTNESFIALRGKLTVGSSWQANENIDATVEDHYDYYDLVGRAIQYEDVIVVKYVDARDPKGTYLLRFFANGYGLIHEKRVVESENEQPTEVSNLRLLERVKVPGSTTHPQRDHWWDAHGRYIITPVILSDEQ